MYYNAFFCYATLVNKSEEGSRVPSVFLPFRIPQGSLFECRARRSCRTPKEAQLFSPDDVRDTIRIVRIHGHGESKESFFRGRPNLNLSCPEFFFVKN